MTTKTQLLLGTAAILTGLFILGGMQGIGFGLTIMGGLAFLFGIISWSIRH